MTPIERLLAQPQALSRTLIFAVGIGAAVFGLPAFAALALGAVIALVAAAPVLPAQRANGIGNRWMKGSIIALGAGMNLTAVLEAGVDGFLSTAITLGCAILLGIGLGKALGVSRSLATLVTVGTAICGGSAIAATAPAIRARAEDIGVSLGVVFVLNAVALVLFPAVGSWLGLDATTFGTWSALAIHDTSSVVGAAAVHSPDALQIATITKLARSLWIVPVVLVVSALARRSASDSQHPAAALKLPTFILGFLAIAAVVTFVPALQPAGSVVAELGRRGLVLALFFIGLGFSRQTVRALGWRPFALGLGLWITLGAGSLIALML